MFKSLAFRAKDVIVAVARACHGMQSMALQLENDLRQLTEYVRLRRNRHILVLMHSCSQNDGQHTRVRV